MGAGVIIIDDDFPEIRAVDSKLVSLAKKYGADVVTNDYNLNKVAEIQSVQVLNITADDSAYAMFLLEDGTMVVVENGVRYMNSTVDVTVTRVLQTTAGRMIFTRVANAA